MVFLGRRLAARTLPPVTIRELRLALQDEWATMPQLLIDTLILSMGRRCETCLAQWMCHHQYNKIDERILRKIHLASRELADDSRKNAAKEEVSASGSNEICVSGDGTWKTRGHTSRIGMCSVIGDVTGKVIDVAVLSSYCKEW
ncbi:hypothetical protein TNCV_3921651 [Trichonephila clavipes]|nr:hypothetical protein TNCV_3921651 [Trichonephila clavipes]